ncbi:Cysteine-rich repeat secretory protein 38 [Bienertia sinuspersici]
MLILILCQIFVYSFSYATAQRNFISHVCQDTFGNYTSNSAFEKNLNTLFSTMLSDTKIDHGFYNISVGQNFDVVHGIGLCRPDVSATDCRNCLSEGTRAIVLNCRNQKDAVGWKMEIGPWYPLHSRVLYKIFGISKERFNHSASTLLTKLQAKAASGDSHRKFGAGEPKITSSFSIYALFDGIESTTTTTVNLSSCTLSRRQSKKEVETLDENSVSYHYVLVVTCRTLWMLLLKEEVKQTQEN